jgi:RNA-directed DNA polymerase
LPRHSHSKYWVRAAEAFTRGALSVLDEHFDQHTISTVERAKRRRHGLANYRLIRYSDDLVIMMSGNQAQAEALLPAVAAVLGSMGLRLSTEKTMITHIDEGLDFLGWRIQRHRKRGQMSATSTPIRRRKRCARSRRAASAEPDVAGLDGPLPARGASSDFPVPAVLSVAPGHALDSQEAPPDQLGGTASPLVVARRR